MNNLTTFYIVRHGESEGNAHYDAGMHFVSPSKFGSDLTVLGRSQAEGLKKKFQNIHFDAVFSSPLLRAKRTAEVIAAERELAIITKDRLEERRKGNLNGIPEKELRTKVKHLFGDYTSLPEDEIWTWKLFDDMESAEESVSRFITELREIAIAFPRKTILIVSHGNIMRSLLVKLGYGTFKELSTGSIENTGYYILDSDGVDFFIKEAHGVTKKA